jgi:hypothetical protein
MTTIDLINRKLHVDLSKPKNRKRAWRRVRVFQKIATECEADGNPTMAATLRRICQKAFDASLDEDQRLVYMAMLAGPDQYMKKGARRRPSPSAEATQ